MSTHTDFGAESISMKNGLNKKCDRSERVCKIMCINVEDKLCSHFEAKQGQCNNIFLTYKIIFWKNANSLHAKKINQE